MLLFALAYIGGVLTIASPCILPVLPFVFARADQPFLRRGLPMLLGMGLTFAVVATLAAVGGGWAVQANEYGRYLAIALLALFGVTLLFPELSDRLTRPLVALGGRLSESADRNENAGSVWPSLLLGIATGLLWAPCAGPVLGLILTGAALQGANVQTTFLLLAYAAGAATSLALALLIGGRVFTAMKRSLGAGEWVRRGLGAAVLVAVVAIFFGVDTGFLTQISLANTASLEQSLIDRIHPASAKVAAESSSSVVMPEGGGAMMSANPSMMMSANAPTMAMTGKPVGKVAAEPLSSVVMPEGGGGAMMSANPSMMMSANAPTMAMNGNPGAMMKAAEAPPSKALPVEGSLPSLTGAVEWLNSPPLTPEQLKGKVVLVDFWTYSCINCLRSIPYVRAWADKYKDQGLVVIGVHAPEFAFEKNIGNVKQAVAKLRIDYPVAVDNDYAIWRAFNNEYWPADYFIDANGKIRHHFFGEGDYAESEKVIQQLLAEAGRGNLPVDMVSVSATGAEAASDAADVKSPETYIGFARSENFASPGGAVGDTPHVYSTGDLKPLNNWGLSGDWTVGGQSATLNKTDGAIAFRFHARDLHLVLGPSADGKPVRFRVTIDGAKPGESHGADVNSDGEGVVTDHRLYQLVRESGPIVDHTFSIQFLDPDVQAYAFTFG
jgi:cytochrome c biogenesis protein CcdA/thiol-disulfide isomerase/thioredoxin